MVPPERGLIDRLPHSRPALLLTDAQLEPGGVSCKGLRKITGRDPLVNPDGFFPDCLLVEMMAQTAGLILPVEHGGAYVAGMREISICDTAREGESLEVLARLNRSMGALFIFDCRAETSGRLLATGIITLRAF